jgi:1,4-alpha-glucan branching enzyme
MIHLVEDVYDFQALPVEQLWSKDDDQVLAFSRGNLVFVFNWAPFKSYEGYGILAPEGEYEVVLSSDSKDFGGFGNIDEATHHFTIHDPLYASTGKGWLKLYMPARTCQVLRKK